MSGVSSNSARGAPAHGVTKSVRTTPKTKPAPNTRKK
jgi:hypothetical protein